MKKKIELNGITYMVWLGVERGTDITDLLEYVKTKIQKGIMSGFYPHFEVKQLNK